MWVLPTIPTAFNEGASSLLSENQMDTFLDGLNLTGEFLALLDQLSAVVGVDGNNTSRRTFANQDVAYEYTALSDDLLSHATAGIRERLSGILDMRLQHPLVYGYVVYQLDGSGSTWVRQTYYDYGATTENFNSTIVALNSIINKSDFGYSDFKAYAHWRMVESYRRVINAMRVSCSMIASAYQFASALAGLYSGIAKFAGGEVGSGTADDTTQVIISNIRQRAVTAAAHFKVNLDLHTITVPKTFSGDAIRPMIEMKASYTGRSSSRGIIKFRDMGKCVANLGLPEGNWGSGLEYYHL